MEDCGHRVVADDGAGKHRLDFGTERSRFTGSKSLDAFAFAFAIVGQSAFKPVVFVDPAGYDDITFRDSDHRRRGLSQTAREGGGMVSMILPVEDESHYVGVLRSCKSES